MAPQAFVPTGASPVRLNIPDLVAMAARIRATSLP